MAMSNSPLPDPPRWCGVELSGVVVEGGQPGVAEKLG
jgi:hypothetical protein